MGTIAQYIDHTLLKPEASRREIMKLCEEAIQFQFASVCVNSCYVPLAAELLKDSGVKTCCVVGFPLGACMTSVKIFEAEEALKKGAQELDMVISVGAVKSGDWAEVEKDIREVAEVVHRYHGILKVILETCLLTEDEKYRSCQAAERAGADFVKTSTGFSSGGALEDDVRLMRETVGDRMSVKASGGIRTLESVRSMIAAGADRIGTSHGVTLAEDEWRQMEGLH